MVSESLEVGQRWIEELAGTESGERRRICMLSCQGVVLVVDLAGKFSYTADSGISQAVKCLELDALVKRICEMKWIDIGKLSMLSAEPKSTLKICQELLTDPFYIWDAMKLIYFLRPECRKCLQAGEEAWTGRNNSE